MCRPRVLRRCFRSERARTRAVNLGALRQRRRQRPPYSLSPKEEEDRPDVFPASTNPTEDTGARKGSSAEIYLTRISRRERALPWLPLRARLTSLRAEKRKWDFCVDVAGSFFCSRRLFARNDRLPMSPAVHLPASYSSRISIWKKVEGNAQSIHCYIAQPRRARAQFEFNSWRYARKCAYKYSTATKITSGINEMYLTVWIYTADRTIAENALTRAGRATLLNIIGEISRSETQIIDTFYEVFRLCGKPSCEIWSVNMREITPRRE